VAVQHHLLGLHARIPYAQDHADACVPLPPSLLPLQHLPLVLARGQQWHHEEGEIGQVQVHDLAGRHRLLHDSAESFALPQQHEAHALDRKQLVGRCREGRRDAAKSRTARGVVEE